MYRLESFFASDRALSSLRVVPPEVQQALFLLSVFCYPRFDQKSNPLFSFGMMLEPSERESLGLTVDLMPGSRSMIPLLGFYVDPRLWTAAFFKRVFCFPPIDPRRLNPRKKVLEPRSSPPPHPPPPPPPPPHLHPPPTVKESMPDRLFSTYFPLAFPVRLLFFPGAEGQVSCNTILSQVRGSPLRFPFLVSMASCPSRGEPTAETLCDNEPASATRG